LAIFLSFLITIAMAIYPRQATSEHYDREKYLEMLLDSAESVLAIFGFSRSLYGFDNNKKSYHWWNELYEQCQRGIETAKSDL
jgi:hypothetical protein